MIFCRNFALGYLRPWKFILVKDFGIADGCEEFERAGLYQLPVGAI